MNETSQTYRYGASYSPLVYPESEWDIDLERMQIAGMNLIRIGDVHGSWDRIEPQRGKFQFDILGAFYARAAQYGLDIILSTGAACPPLWLETDYPDVRIVSSRGERYPLAASYHWACIHHPGFLQESDRYLAGLAAFVLDQPSHFGWQISNEIGFPFNPTREPDRLDLYCYCDHCKQRFRQWVKAKYHTLEALNDAWMWSTTAFWHNDWEEVSPPEAKPGTWSGVTRWLDWRLFWQEAFADFTRHQHEQIRLIDQTHPTSVNTFNFKGYDRFGVTTGLDQWQLAEAVDHIGYDLYPGSGSKLKSRPEHNSIFLDHGRCVSRTAGTAFWLHEIESGPIGGWVLGPDYNTSPVDIWRNGLEALGHDVKMILYMPWKEWDYQPLRWGALVDLDGQPTPRLKAAEELGQYICRNDEFLIDASVPQGDVALLESKPNAIFFNGVGQEDILFKAQRGAYRAFWEQDFLVDFVTPAHIGTPEFQAYRAVALPLMGLMSRETAAGLRAYVQQGGIVIGFARCGTLTEQGWYYHQLPISELADVFGVVKCAADTLDSLQIHYGGSRYNGTLNRDLVLPRADTEILAQFDDGHPAVTFAQCGKGCGVYIATQADSGYLSADGGFLKDVLSGVFQRLSIEPRGQVIYPGREFRHVDYHMLESSDRTTILLANYYPEDITIQFRFDAAGRTVDHIQAGLIDIVLPDWERKGKHIILNLMLSRGEGEAIDIFWQSN